MTEINPNNKDIIEALINVDISNTGSAFPPVGDFHTANGIAFFGYDRMYKAYKENYHEFKDILRDTAKKKGLALTYGLGWKGLLDIVDNNETKAKELYNAFFANLPVVSKNMKKLLDKTKKDLYLTNLLGRRLYIRKWESDDWRDQASARNNTLNYGKQSLGADITKLILFKVSQYIEKNVLDRNMGNLITKDYCSRILTLEVTDDTELDDIEFELDCLEVGHTKIVLLKEGKPYLEYDRLVKIPMSMITDIGFNIFH